MGLIKKLQNIFFLHKNMKKLIIFKNQFNMLYLVLNQNLKQIFCI